MPELLFNALLLGLIQGAIPNHWLPVTALGLSENWNRSVLINIATICAGAHVIGTVIVGIPFFIFDPGSVSRFDRYFHIIAPVFLITFSLLYLVVYKLNLETNSRWSWEHTWIALLIGCMFLSPCLEAERMFTSAAQYGSDNILLLAFIYAMSNICTILLLTVLSKRLIPARDAVGKPLLTKPVAALIIFSTGILSFFLH